MKKISLLGATGSIGTQTLDVVRQHPDSFSIAGMAFGRNITLARQIISEFKPSIVCVAHKNDCELLQKEFVSDITFVYGEQGLIEVASMDEADLVLNAVMGSVGLASTLAAIESNKTVALANKESLVTAGHIVMEKVKKHGVALLPVDSEHSAILQCLQGERIDEISRLILTASGGSFRNKTRDQLENVTVKDALKHPNWSMGSKITIDSATMMNKGLEVIEAHWFFGIPYDQIDVLLHKESIVHSMVEFIDGSVIAHLGNPDMKVPIQYALSYPSRLELEGSKRLNLWEAKALHFDKMDFDRFPCLRFAVEAGKAGGTMPAVLNAANEIAVEAFLRSEISFLDIDAYIEKALSAHTTILNPPLEVILEVDSETRQMVRSSIEKGG
jgi:1-deoxy-D-xylulose-5-phosphate reductoisomerase